MSGNPKRKSAQTGKRKAGTTAALKFLKINSVALRYDTSRSTIWRWSTEARFSHLGFPRPIPIGPRDRVWEVVELDAYDERRRALRDQATAA
jgi:predicted DNA-binding transcriptional regulator AlpA